MTVVLEVLPARPRVQVDQSGSVHPIILTAIGIRPGAIPEKKDQAAHRKKQGSRGGRPVSHDADPYKDPTRTTR